jgi:glycerol-3-phosphate dehydrogenase
MAAPERALAARADLVVVGGGINGAGLARDAALRGYRVVLLERDDFGAGSSSRTSKLVHGGIRYLEHGALRLVWEASHERRTLLLTAPHLVRPLPFVFPVYRDSRFGPWKLRAGMWLYDVLASFRNVASHRMLSVRQGANWREGLRDDGLRGAALYWDAAMDDARLVLANVLGAVAAGAQARNRTEVTGIDALPEGLRVTARDAVHGSQFTVDAAAVAVCAGPWSNEFFARLGDVSRPLAPTRGTHIVVPRLTERAFTLAAGSDGRVFFVLPWLDGTLVGTTDVDDDGDPARVAATEAEIAYLLSEANRYFPEARLQRRDVRATYAGLRPLLRSGGNESSRSREHAFLEPMPGVLAIAGGKYTTYRAVAEAAVDRLAQRLGRRGPCRTASLALPGGDLAWTPREHWDESSRFVAQARTLAAAAQVEEDVARTWLRVHGTRAAAIAALAAGEPRWRQRLCPHVAATGADVVHAVRDEMALHLEDWFVRRSRNAFAACNGRDALAPVAALFAAELGWSATERDARVAACAATLETIAAVVPAATPSGPPGR